VKISPTALTVRSNISTGGYSSRYHNSDILAVLDTTAGHFGIQVYDPNHPFLLRFDENQVASMHFLITRDDDNSVVDFNGHHPEFVLITEPAGDHN